MSEVELLAESPAQETPQFLFAFCLFKYFPFGGLQRDFIEIARRCLRHGHRIRVYTQSWEGERPPGFDIVEVPARGLTNHRRCVTFADWVRDDIARSPVDLVVGFNKMPGLDVYYAADSCFVEKAHSQRSALYRLMPRYRVFSDLEHAVFGRQSSARIMMIAPQQLRFFKRHHATPEDRVTNLPPGLPPERIRRLRAADPQPDLRASLGIAPDARLILFVGSGFRKKGLDRAIRAIASLPAAERRSTHLCVLGEDTAAPYERLAMWLAVREQVHFLGGREDVPDFMATADLMVLPALDENAGIVILEALFAGLPLIVSDVCGYAEHVRDADAGIVLPEPFRQRDFNAALLQVFDCQRRAQWREGARHYTETHDLTSLHDRAAEVIEETALSRVGTRGRPVFAFCLYKYFPWGGLQRDMLRIALACMDRGYRIRVYAMSWQGERPEGFDYVQVPVTALTNHHGYEKYQAWVNRHLREHPADIVVGFNKIPGLDVYFAADGCYLEKARRTRNFLYRSTSRFHSLSTLERAVFEPGAATDILVLTSAQQREYQDCYGTEDARFKLLPPGVSRSRQRPPDADLIRARMRSELDVPAAGRLLLTVGSGFVTKGLDRTLQALANLPEPLAERTRLLVIGQDKRGPFERLAGRLGVRDRVEFLGGRDNVLDYMLAADVLVHPAYAESAGIVLLEAVIAGLPVVATAVCGYSGHIVRSGCGRVLAEPFDGDELDRTLLEMLTSPDWVEWSRAGVAYGQRERLFDLPEFALEHIEVCYRRKGAPRVRPA